MNGGVASIQGYKMGLVSLVIGFYDISIARAHDNLAAGLDPEYIDCIRDGEGMLTGTGNDIRLAIEDDKNTILIKNMVYINNMLTIDCLPLLEDGTGHASREPRRKRPRPASGAPLTGESL
jgi:hypothetical protein